MIWNWRHRNRHHNHYQHISWFSSMQGILPLHQRMPYKLQWEHGASLTQWRCLYSVLKQLVKYSIKYITIVHSSLAAFNECFLLSLMICFASFCFDFAFVLFKWNHALTYIIVVQSRCPHQSSFSNAISFYSWDLGLFFVLLSVCVCVFSYSVIKSRRSHLISSYKSIAHSVRTCAINWMMKEKTATNKYNKQLNAVAAATAAPIAWNTRKHGGYLICSSMWADVNWTLGFPL